ncbi:MAG: hypothetical protein J3K34DRAFT_45162, partial [Monoraphidium minutum]
LLHRDSAGADSPNACVALRFCFVVACPPRCCTPVQAWTVSRRPRRCFAPRPPLCGQPPKHPETPPCCASLDHRGAHTQYRTWLRGTAARCSALRNTAPGSSLVGATVTSATVQHVLRVPAFPFRQISRSVSPSRPLRPMEVPKEYGLLAGTVVASWFTHHMYMAVKVMKARKKYEVKYPALYADKDNCPNEANRAAFNCVQRGHQNSLENLPTFLGLLTIAGIKHPVAASAFGACYLVGRVAYMEGYSTGNPEKRMNAGTAVGYVGLFGLVGTCITIAVKSFTAN